MQEKEYYQSIIQEYGIDDVAVKAAAYRSMPRRKVVLHRAAAIAGLCAAALIVFVFAMPQTRAEVLSWFGISKPEDYLTVRPEDRPSIPDIDSLITTPAPSAQAVNPIPVEQPVPETVENASAAALSAFLYENCDVRLGEALFDGDTIYQTIHMNGLSGRYLWDEWTSGMSTAVRIDPETAINWGEDGEPFCVFADGEAIWFQRAFGSIQYELSDGTRFGGSLDLAFSQTEPFLNTAEVRALREGEQTAEKQQALDALSTVYLEKNGLIAFAAITPDDWERHADADGNLTAKVLYTVRVDVLPPGSPESTSVLFRAELGTITVNMRGYQEIEARPIERAGAPVVWGAEMLTLGKADGDFGEGNAVYEQVRFAKQAVSMEDVTMTAETDAAQIDALGVHNIRIRITLPASWTQEQREMLAASPLYFTAAIDGLTENPLVVFRLIQLTEDGSILLSGGQIEQIPYEMLPSVRRIVLIPTLQSFESVKTYDADGNLLEYLEPAGGETAVSTVGCCYYSLVGETIKYPRYAIELTVN